MTTYKVHVYRTDDPKGDYDKVVQEASFANKKAAEDEYNRLINILGSMVGLPVIKSGPNDRDGKYVQYQNALDTVGVVLFAEHSYYDKILDETIQALINY